MVTKMISNYGHNCSTVYATDYCFNILQPPQTISQLRGLSLAYAFFKYLIKDHRLIKLSQIKAQNGD